MSGFSESNLIVPWASEISIFLAVHSLSSAFSFHGPGKHVSHHGSQLTDERFAGPCHFVGISQ